VHETLLQFGRCWTILSFRRCCWLADKKGFCCCHKNAILPLLTTSAGTDKGSQSIPDWLLPFPISQLCFSEEKLEMSEGLLRDQSLARQCQQ